MSGSPSRRRAGGPVARWLAARARNALRRPLRIIGATVAAFLVALVLLLLMPREAMRAANVPPVALLAAALVLGAALGFGITLGLELWRPRVADAEEAARVADTRSLAVISPIRAHPDRMRRSADKATSPLLNPSAPGYRVAYLHLAREWAGANRLPMVAVTGDESDVVASVAANVAVAAAYDSRVTLLIDADRITAGASAIFGVSRTPGVEEAMAGRVAWAEAIVAATVGRGRTIDVIPPGDPPAPEAGQSVGADAGEQPHDEGRMGLERLARRYDVSVVAAPLGIADLGSAGPLVALDAIVCARVAYTTLARLGESAETLRLSGLRLQGVVVWDADAPSRAVPVTGPRS